MSNKVYDFLKFFVTIFLQAFGTLLLALGDTWSIPYARQIALTILAIVTFVSTLLANASINYMKDKEIKEKEDKIC